MNSLRADLSARHNHSAAIRRRGGWPPLYALGVQLAQSAALTNGGKISSPPALPRGCFLVRAVTFLQYLSHAF
jgi:hypothetical protein